MAGNTIAVTDGSTTEQCRIVDTIEHRGEQFIEIEGDEIDGWIERPDSMPRLNCTRCNQFTAYNREQERVVRCGVCDKRHSNDSLHLVEPLSQFERDEDGVLESPPPRLT